MATTVFPPLGLDSLPEDIYGVLMDMCDDETRFRMDLTSKQNLAGYLWNFVSSISTNSLIMRPWKYCHLKKFPGSEDDQSYLCHQYFKRAIATITQRIAENSKKNIRISHCDRSAAKGSPTVNYFAPLFLELAPRARHLDLDLRDDTAKLFFDKFDQPNLSSVKSLTYTHSESSERHHIFLNWLTKKLPEMEQLTLNFSGHTTQIMEILEKISQHSGRLRFLSLAFRGSIDNPSPLVELLKAISLANIPHIESISLDFFGSQRPHFFDFLKLDSADWSCWDERCKNHYQVPLRKFSVNRQKMWEFIIGNREFWPDACGGYESFEGLFSACYGEHPSSESVLTLGTLIRKSRSDDSSLDHSALSYAFDKTEKWLSSADLDILMFDVDCIKVVTELMGRLSKSSDLPTNLSGACLDRLVSCLRQITLIDPSRIRQYGIVYHLDPFLGDCSWVTPQQLDLSFCCYPMPTRNRGMVARAPIRGIISSNPSTLLKLLPFLGTAPVDAAVDGSCLLAVLADKFAEDPEYSASIMEILKLYRSCTFKMLPLIKELKLGSDSRFLSILQDSALCREFFRAFMSHRNVFMAICRCTLAANLVPSVLSSLLDHQDPQVLDAGLNALYLSLFFKSKSSYEIQAGLNTIWSSCKRLPSLLTRFSMHSDH